MPRSYPQTFHLWTASDGDAGRGRDGVALLCTCAAVAGRGISAPSEGVAAALHQGAQLAPVVDLVVVEASHWGPVQAEPKKTEGQHSRII